MTTQKPEQNNLKDSLPTVIRFELSPVTLFTLVVGAFFFWLIIQLLPALLVLIAAFFIVGSLNLPVTWLENHRFNRHAAIAVVFAALFIAILLIGLFTLPTLGVQVSTLLQQAPTLQIQLADWLSRYPLGTYLSTWLRHSETHDVLPNNIGSTAFTYSMRIIVIFTYAVSSMFLALYIMLDRDRLRGGLFALVPRAHHILLSRVLLNLENIVGAYIRGQVITSVLISIFTFILLSACHIQNALALSVFAGIADILPYIGSLLTIAPVVIAAIPHGQIIVMVTLLFMLLYEEFESRILIPRVYGQVLRLPSSVVFFALIVGGTLMGILGALLALPVAATIMMLLSEFQVQLPGEQEKDMDEAMRKNDNRAEKEYERRTEGIPIEKSASIAIEMSEELLKNENTPPEKTK